MRMKLQLLYCRMALSFWILQKCLWSLCSICNQILYYIDVPIHPRLFAESQLLKYSCPLIESNAILKAKSETKRYIWNCMCICLEMTQICYHNVYRKLKAHVHTHTHTHTHTRARANTGVTSAYESTFYFCLNSPRFSFTCSINREMKIINSHLDTVSMYNDSRCPPSHCMDWTSKFEPAEIF